jgi:hypothetical protein
MTWAEVCPERSKGTGVGVEINHTQPENYLIDICICKTYLKTKLSIKPSQIEYSMKSGSTGFRRNIVEVSTTLNMCHREPSLLAKRSPCQQG